MENAVVGKSAIREDPADKSTDFNQQMLIESRHSMTIESLEPFNFSQPEM